MNKWSLRIVAVPAIASVLSGVTAGAAFADDVPRQITPEQRQFSRQEAVQIDTQEAAEYAALGLSAASVPPSCVTVRVDKPGVYYRSAFVTNRCPAQQRVIVVWAFDPDSNCLIINPGKTVEDRHTRVTGQERFDGLINC